MLARQYLVRDLDAALRTLSANLDFEPAGPTVVDERDGCRVAVMAVTMRQAATLELVQPLDGDKEAGRYLAAFGPGPYYTRIGVAGVEAKADDLLGRGTKFAQALGGTKRLRVDPNEIDGALFEFVEIED